MIWPKPKHKRTNTDVLFEKLPPFILLIALISIPVGGVFFPDITSYFIITINVFFLYKSAHLSITFAIAFLKIRQGESINWQNKLLALNDVESAKIDLEKELTKLKSNYETKLINQKNYLVKIFISREYNKAKNYLTKELTKLNNIKVYSSLDEIQHIIIIPHVKEPEHILKETLDNLAMQTFNKKQINIVLAAEGRDPLGLPLSKKLAADYKDVFNNIWLSNHILEDHEAVGKSSNMRAGGLLAYEKVKKLGWDLEKTILTSCDADSKLPSQYFSYVTYEFISRADAKYKFFNAGMAFYNNIWKLPFYARIKNSMSTLFNVSRLIRTDKLVPFSTYSTSFWTIEQIDFWTPWVTPEDFHIFFKAQFRLGENVSTVPIFLRIMSDSAEGKGHIDTIRNNYMQERRWSWGVSDDGWILQNVVFRFWQNGFIVNYRALHSVFDHIVSPYIGLILMVGGNIPPLVNPAFNLTVLGAQLPRVSSAIITLSLIFLIFIIVVDLFFRPERKNKLGLLNIPFQLAEWAFLPIASFTLSLLPGIEANTRLLFGKHLEYYVTKKH